MSKENGKIDIIRDKVEELQRLVSKHDATMVLCIQEKDILRSKHMIINGTGMGVHNLLTKCLRQSDDFAKVFRVAWGDYIKAPNA